MSVTCGGGPPTVYSGLCCVPSPKAVLGSYPYIRTAVHNLDVLIPYFNVYVAGTARRGWLLPPPTTPVLGSPLPVQVRLESVAASLGRGGSPATATLGSPVVARGLPVPVGAPFALLVEGPAGQGVIGEAPALVTYTTPLSWTPAPTDGVFPPAGVATGGGSLRAAPAVGSCPGAPASASPVVTGTQLTIHDNSASCNVLRAVVDPADPTGQTYTLVWSPPGAAGANDGTGALPVTLTLVWPQCAGPGCREVLPILRPRRGPRPSPCDAVGAPGKSCGSCPFT
jgi:hypothetical protein